MNESPRLSLTAWVLAASAGAAVLVVELGIGRLLTPVFGGSIEVWAIVIAMTMAALALGYAVGGQLADRAGGLRVARIAAIAAGGWIALTPTAAAPTLRATADLPTALGSALASFVLLLPSLAALGMISPALIRAAARPDAIGSAAGRIYAVSTLGSLAGALLAGLVALPAMSVGVVLWWTAALLCGAVALTRWRVGWGATAVVAAWACYQTAQPTPLPRLTPTNGPSIEVLARYPSPHGEVRVVQWGHRRLMLSNGVDQGGIDVNTGRSAYGYNTHMVAAASLYRTGPARTALLIGLGPGVIAADLRRRGLTVDQVEIDPAVVQAARDWFGVDTPVVIEDGRRMLALSGARWDVIYVDAFLSGSPPWQLYTQEAFAAYRDHLNPGGVVVINVIGNETDPAQRPALDAILHTASTTFATVEAWPDPRQSQDYPTHNLYVVATDAERRLRAADPHQQRLLDRGAYGSADGRLLTDVNAPLDVLLRTTAAHVRRRGATYLPTAIRVDGV